MERDAITGPSTPLIAHSSNDRAFEKARAKGLLISRRIGPEGPSHSGVRPSGGSGPQIRTTPVQDATDPRGPPLYRVRPSGGSGTQVLKWRSPQQSGGVTFNIRKHPLLPEGGRAGYFCFDFSPAIAFSPFHISTDIVVIGSSCARYNIAEHSKIKCTSDLEIERIQVFQHTFKH